MVKHRVTLRADNSVCLDIGIESSVSVTAIYGEANHGTVRQDASFPVNVSVNVPWLTLFEANKVILAVAEPFNMTELRLMVQVELGGPPLQLRETLPVRPPLDVNEIV